MIQTFRRLLDQADLPPWRLHDLRHGCASLMLAQGANLRTIMEQLGHSSIAMTANLYAHVAPELMREAAGMMDDALGAAGSESG